MTIQRISITIKYQAVIACCTVMSVHRHISADGTHIDGCGVRACQGRHISVGTDGALGNHVREINGTGNEQGVVHQCIHVDKGTNTGRIDIDRVRACNGIRGDAAGDSAVGKLKAVIASRTERFHIDITSNIGGNEQSIIVTSFGRNQNLGSSSHCNVPDDLASVPADRDRNQAGFTGDLEVVKAGRIHVDFIAEE